MRDFTVSAEDRKVGLVVDDDAMHRGDNDNVHVRGRSAGAGLFGNSREYSKSTTLVQHVRDISAQYVRFDLYLLKSDTSPP